MFLLSLSVAWATILTVPPYPDITTAIDAADPGDEIHVDAGEWSAPGVITKDITIRPMLGVALPTWSGAETLIQDGASVYIAGFRFLPGSRLVVEDATLQVKQSHFIGDGVTGQPLSVTNGSLEVVGVRIARQVNGPAIRAVGSDVVVASSEFLRNEAVAEPTAIRVDDGSLVVRNSVFENHELTYVGDEFYGGDPNTWPLLGAGVIWVEGTMTLTDSTFEQNTIHFLPTEPSPWNPWPPRASGGAVEGTGDALVANTTFRNNRIEWEGEATGRGSGMAWGGTLQVTSSSFDQGVSSGLWATGRSLDVRDCQFTHNDGVGLEVSTDFAVITDSHFEGNHAQHGGGLEARHGTTFIDNTTFHANTATHGGGGAFLGGFGSHVSNSVFTDNESLINGGAVHIDQGTHTLDHTQFIGNVAADDGGGIYADDWSIDLTIRHSWLCGNAAGQQGGGLAVETGHAQLRTASWKTTRPASGAAPRASSTHGTVPSPTTAPRTPRG